MADKHQFNAPADEIERASEEAERAAALVGPAALVGTWNACDASTRGIVRVVIAAAGQGITVHVFGACTPTPCDWGQVNGRAYADNVSSNAAVAFTANYRFEFKETLVTGVLDAGSLRVEMFNHFTDSSGRSDYYMKGYFCRARPAQHSR